MHGPRVLHPSASALSMDHGPLAAVLATRLVESGALKSDTWRRAFERVPRHVFVPRFYLRDRESPGYTLVTAADACWLSEVYDPAAALITGYDSRSGAPTSSSSAPEIMAPMLELLDVASGHKVLEIGTGSGYNAALLCERLRSDNVTSIDVDPELVELARRRLSSLGYNPTLAARDGAEGYVENAPYNRIIATCTFRAVPHAWVQQTRAGGLILAILPECMALLQKADVGSASGHLTGYRTWFMEAHARPGHPHLSPEKVRSLVSGPGDRRPLRFPLRTVMGGQRIPDFWSLARLVHLPHSSEFFLGEGRLAIVARDDLSWALLDVEGHVIQGGPRRIWDRCEELYEVMEQAGRPGRDRFGLTVRPDGSQFVWLDDPHGHRWELS